LDRRSLDQLLASLERGESTREEVLEQLARLPFRDLGDARIDLHRALRAGLPEVVLGAGKSADQIERIARVLLAEQGCALVTRVDAAQADEVRRHLPELEYFPQPRILARRNGTMTERFAGPVVVVCAGTADLPVAEEAAFCAEFFGQKVERVYDAGVAGLHRLLASLDVLRSARVAIAVAGMEGALPSVVGGLIARPVIAVPTSVGYGASFGGVAALLAMLNSCASNVVAVNIDNGFGAAYAATMMNRV
jgi:pyridinium-3,5-biscarboxylic acid mononucleotide synthase